MRPFYIEVAEIKIIYHNEAGLTFHDKVFDCCKKHGIEPLVIISHYETLYRLYEKYNGFADRRVAISTSTTAR